MVYILLGNGFEEMEAVAPIDLLRRAGVEIITVGVNGKSITGSHKIIVEADITIDQIDLTNMEMVVLPGGLGGVASLRACSAVYDVLRFAKENDKYVAAICAGPTVLADIGICDGKKATCYPGHEKNMGAADMQPNAAAVVDGKLITGTSAGCAVPFALELIKVLKGEEAAETVKKQIAIR